MSTIEVEQRANLSLEERSDILEYMDGLGPVQKIARVMIDFSGPDRTRTVVLRVKNGAMELVAKTGKLADGARNQASLPLAPDAKLGDALSYLAIMGHTQGMVSLRRVQAVSSNDLEYSVRDVVHPPDGLVHAATLLEIEALNVAPGQEEMAAARVQSAFDSHGLQTLDPEAWHSWVDNIYTTVDQPFNNTPQNAMQLTDALTAGGWLEAR